MILKIIIPLLILLSFFNLTSSLNSWNICVGDGCSFSNNCDIGICENETVGQHINERSSLFNIVLSFRQSIVLSLFLFLIKRELFKEVLSFYLALYYKYKFFNYHRTKLFHYLSKFLSQGLLHPKIY